MMLLVMLLLILLSVSNFLCDEAILNNLLNAFFLAIVHTTQSKAASL
jgi:hypothetical protein